MLCLCCHEQLQHRGHATKASGRSSTKKKVPSDPLSRAINLGLAAPANLSTLEAAELERKDNKEFYRGLVREPGSSDN